MCFSGGGETDVVECEKTGEPPARSSIDQFTPRKYDKVVG